jgi:hypothetical protein
VKPPFERIVADHGPTVLRVCRVVLGVHDAQDAWSETFLAARARLSGAIGVGECGGAAGDDRAPQGDRGGARRRTQSPAIAADTTSVAPTCSRCIHACLARR